MQDSKSHGVQGVLCASVLSLPKYLSPALLLRHSPECLGVQQAQSRFPLQEKMLFCLLCFPGRGA